MSTAGEASWPRPMRLAWLLLLFVLGWWTEAPFGVIAQAWPSGVLLVGSLALVAGYLGAVLPAVLYAAGVAVGSLLSGDLSAGLLLWVAGLLGGLVADQLPNTRAWRAWRRERRRRRNDRELERDFERAIRTAETGTPLAPTPSLEKPEMHVRLINSAHLLVAAAPSAMAVAVVVLSRIPAGMGAPVLLGGVLITLAYTASHVSLRRITRYRRREIQLGDTFAAWFATLLAIGPAGQWVVSAWRDHPWLYRNALLVLVALTLILLADVWVVTTQRLVRAERSEPPSLAS